MEDNKLGSIGLSGEIVQGDFEEYLEFFNIIKKKDRIVGVLLLNSKGGLVSEALRIGRHARKNGLATRVEKDGECYSSCALIWFSGLRRYNPEGKLGVHRSYLKNSGKMSFSEMEQSLGSNHKIIQEYLVEMRVPATIIEDFLSTPSSEIKLIKNIEALENDRLFEEYLISSCGTEQPLFSKGPDWWECYDDRAVKLSEGGDPIRNGRLIEREEVKYYNLDSTTRNLCMKWENYQNSEARWSTNPKYEKYYKCQNKNFFVVLRELQFGK